MAVVQFSEVERHLLREVLNRHQNELSETLKLIYDEHGLLEEVKAGKKFKLLQDLSGVEEEGAVEENSKIK